MKRKTIRNIQFFIGIVLALTGATLMFFDQLAVSAQITIGVVGLLLMVTSKRKMELF